MVWQTKLKFRQRRNVIRERFATVYFVPREYRTKFSEYNLVSVREGEMDQLLPKVVTRSCV